MASWVRYSVAAYVGLLLSGSLVLSPSTTVGSGGGSSSVTPAVRVQPPRANRALYDTYDDPASQHSSHVCEHRAVPKVDRR